MDIHTQRLIFDWTVRALLGLGVFALLWYLLRTRAYPKRCCPGPAPSRWAYLWPLTWVRGSACGYDLSNLPETDGRTLCPECGTRSTKARRRRTDQPISSLKLAAVLLALGLGIPTARYIRNGSWVRFVPTPVLMRTHSIMGSWTPARVRKAWQYRMMHSGEVDAMGYGVRKLQFDRPAQIWAAELAIHDLRSDRTDWNASDAEWVIGSLPHELTTPMLEAALLSDDYQQRQMVAEILRWRSGYVPSEAMLKVCVEGLQDDSLPYSSAEQKYTYNANAAAGWDYLASHVERAEPYLADGLASKDWQQRFLCAVIAVAGKREKLMPVAAPILIESLKSNSTFGDARLATAAIVHAGPLMLSYLQPYELDDDEQRRLVVGLIIRRIKEPKAPPIVMYPNDAARITDLANDPSLVNFEWVRRDVPTRSNTGATSTPP